MNNKVPFNQMLYGTRFKYRQEDACVFVKLGHDLVGDWSEAAKGGVLLQGLYCFNDDETPFDTPVFVAENAEPVPPTGAEPEVVANVIATGGPHDREDRVLCELQAELPPVGTELVDRAHVARLQDEVELLVAAKRQKELVIDGLSIENTELQAEVERMLQTAAMYQQKWSNSKSELTKALELLTEALQIDEAADLWLRVKAFLSNQSAPADKGQGEPVAYADPQSFENLKNLAHLGGLYTHEWMWANPAPGLVPLYADPVPVVEANPK